jgi:prepilin-type N-terminal cleavage/methylation domain-containing protein
LVVGRRGFTLVEVLVATAVLAIGISAGVRTLGAMTYSSAAAEDRATAVRLAAQRMALLELATTASSGGGTESIPASGAAGGEVSATGNSEGTFENEPRFQWQQQVSAASEPGLLEVTVTVSWYEGIAERRYTVSTYLLDPGQRATTGVAP